MDSQALVQASEENAFAYLRLFSPASDTVFEEDRDKIISLAPINGVSMITNNVYKTNMDVSAIDGVVERFREAGLPVMWATGPSPEPADLGAQLKRRGFMLVDRYTVMSCDMQGLQPELPEGLNIRDVREMKAFRDWLRLYTICFGLSDGVEEATLNQRYGQFLDQSLPVRHYVGYYNERPVATASVMLDSEVAGIYNITTAPEARGRGFGGALTSHAMSYGKQNGCRYATLQATKLGRPVYERLGFVGHGGSDVYVKLHGLSCLVLPWTLVQRACGNWLRSKLIRLGDRI